MSWQTTGWELHHRGNESGQHPLCVTPASSLGDTALQKATIQTTPSSHHSTPFEGALH